MALVREAELFLVQDDNQIEQIGNGKDLKHLHPTSRSESEKWADNCFQDIASKPIFPPRLYTGPRAIDKLGRLRLGSMVRGDALGFEVKGNKRILRDIYEFGTTDVELGRKWKGMIPFVGVLKSGTFLRDLFKMLEVTGEPVVEGLETINLTFIRRHVPIDNVFEYPKFARVSVRTLG